MKGEDKSRVRASRHADPHTSSARIYRHHPTAFAHSASIHGRPSITPMKQLTRSSCSTCDRMHICVNSTRLMNLPTSKTHEHLFEHASLAQLARAQVSYFLCERCHHRVILRSQVRALQGALPSHHDYFFYRDYFLYYITDHASGVC